MQLESIWAGLGECGWFEELSPSEVSQLRQRLKVRFDRHPPFTFYGLAALTFGTEGFEDPEEEPYAHILWSYSKASGGRFSPSLVTEEYDAESDTSLLTVEVDGQQLQCRVSWADDWFDPEAHELARRALHVSRPDLDFVLLPPCDEAAHVVLVRPEVYVCAERRGLIPIEPPLDEDL